MQGKKETCDTHILLKRDDKEESRKLKTGNMIYRWVEYAII